MKYLMKALYHLSSYLTVDCRISQLPIGLDAAISSGLIINELVKNTLGRNLVKILANNQLDGEAEAVYEGGLKYIIQFPIS